jgi:hypothetical protein
MKNYKDYIKLIVNISIYLLISLFLITIAIAIYYSESISWDNLTPNIVSTIIDTAIITIFGKIIYSIIDYKKRKRIKDSICALLSLSMKRFYDNSSKSYNLDSIDLYIEANKFINHITIATQKDYDTYHEFIENHVNAFSGMLSSAILINSNHSFLLSSIIGEMTALLKADKNNIKNFNIRINVISESIKEFNKITIME